MGGGRTPSGQIGATQGRPGVRIWNKCPLPRPAHPRAHFPPVLKFLPLPPEPLHWLSKASLTFGPPDPSLGVARPAHIQVLTSLPGRVVETHFMAHLQYLETGTRESPTRARKKPTLLMSEGSHKKQDGFLHKMEGLLNENRKTTTTKNFQKRCKLTIKDTKEQCEPHPPNYSKWSRTELVVQCSKRTSPNWTDIRSQIILNSLMVPSL